MRGLLQTPSTDSRLYVIPHTPPSSNDMSGKLPGEELECPGALVLVILVIRRGHGYGRSGRWRRNKGSIVTLVPFDEPFL